MNKMTINIFSKNYLLKVSPVIFKNAYQNKINVEFVKHQHIKENKRIERVQYTFKMESL